MMHNSAGRRQLLEAMGISSGMAGRAGERCAKLGDNCIVRERIM